VSGRHLPLPYVTEDSLHSNGIEAALNPDNYGSGTMCLNAGEAGRQGCFNAGHEEQVCARPGGVPDALTTVGKTPVYSPSRGRYLRIPFRKLALLALALSDLEAVRQTGNPAASRRITVTPSLKVIVQAMLRNSPL
jgi:hypothetical protein